MEFLDLMDLMDLMVLMDFMDFMVFSVHVRHEFDGLEDMTLMLGSGHGGSEGEEIQGSGLPRPLIFPLFMNSLCGLVSEWD
jgi:hypothetical protein